MPRATEVAKKATFSTDDKRAQYARLVVFNFGVQEKSIPKSKDVNTASNSELEKAGKALVAGNLLDGKDGIDLIMKLSKAGSTTGRPLTKAYAQEVRPFLRRLALAQSFGRRGGGPRAKKEETKKSGSAKKGGKSAAKATAAQSSADAGNEGAAESES
jgi:hypothetical protein